MKIITIGDSILRKTSAMIGDIDQGIVDFTSSMFDSLHVGKGIGLAAVQVGEPIRLFVTDIPNDQPRIFINPSITETSIETSPFEEGCLSIPGFVAEVIRSSAIRVQAFDLKGKPFVLTAEDLLARVIQHELDHLNGRLFIDHLNNKKRERLLKGYQNEVQV